MLSIQTLAQTLAQTSAYTPARILAPQSGHYFVTGTDTEIGKTTTAASLIAAIATAGYTCYAIKPVTAGLTKVVSDVAGEQFISEDAKAINQHASVVVPSEAIAPIRLHTPSSPHIAAALDGIALTTADVVGGVQRTLNNYPADIVLIEGAGGWYTPINEHQTLADVAVALGLPVIVVVGVKLGCLNHAMLTVQAIWQAGLTVAAVVFNEPQADTEFFTEQVAWLQPAITQQSADYQRTPPQFATARYQ